jgi:hypothetical protein
MRSRTALASLLVAALAAPSIAAAATTKAQLTPIDPGVVAVASVTLETPPAPIVVGARFTASLHVSPASLVKLGIDPAKLDRATVTVQGSAMSAPIRMTLVVAAPGRTQRPVWRVELVNAVPKLRAGDKVSVYVNGKLALRGIALKSV